LNEISSLRLDEQEKAWMARLPWNRFMSGHSKESPAEAGFERLDEPETPRLKAGAKKSPLKRAEAPFQKKDFWILLMNYPKFSISGDPA